MTNGNYYKNEFSSLSEERDCYNCKTMTVLTASLLLALIASVATLDLKTVYSAEELSNIDESVAQDATLNFTGLVNKYGYPVEDHKVITKDGYILTVHRIPYGKSCGPEKSKIPVLVMHGLLSSSTDFIIMGPKDGLGYILADACYDVWLGNNRGNRYSRKHVKMTTNNGKYWEFSWHEMGAYDDPAMVDYILNVTGHENLHYIGHSQGTTQFFIFGSLYPNYHKKIRSFHALSPVAFMKNIKSPTFRILSIFHKPIHVVAQLVGLKEFMPTCEFLNMIGSNICKDKYPALQAICKSALFLIAGAQGELLNTTMLPAIIGHTPAGASTRQLVHYAQLILEDGFRQYDHGALGNLAKYGSIAPPNYKLSNISVPAAFYYCNNDMLSDVIDVDRLMDLWPKSKFIGKYRVPDNRFSHLDYLWAIGVKNLVYDQLLNIIKRY